MKSGDNWVYIQTGRPICQWFSFFTKQLHFFMEPPHIYLPFNCYANQNHNGLVGNLTYDLRYKYPSTSPLWQRGGSRSKIEVTSI